MRGAPELAIGLGLAAALTGLWLMVRPDAGDTLGHGMGIAGLLLMLVTETAYSIRKRARRATWGPARTWLRAHIVTGIVGPALVLLHGGAATTGLAGWTSAGVLIVVLSGFVGRYLYTAIPRDAEGEERPVASAMRRWFALWHTVHVPLGVAVFVLAFFHVGAAMWFAAGLE